MGKSMRKENIVSSMRRRVAREAAVLLYTGQEKEYKQAKRRAAQTLRVRVLPSNLEVATELDSFAEETEGPLRRERLVQMRREALQVMDALRSFHPRLVGSVWRGTAHRNSDIDILTFSADPTPVLAQLYRSFNVVKTEWQSVTKRGKKESSYHIHLVLPSRDEAEVVVRSLEKTNQKERCEIYGDTATGLGYPQLLRVLRENPLQKFVPQ